jgi:pimeloyl-ACP methyl ester carboxylesterase
MTGMRQEAAIDGFRLAYDRSGTGPAVLLLHGWPGDRTDYRDVAPLFPREWSDRIGEFFSAAELTWLDGAGHFSPLEAPAEFAAAVAAAVTR